MGKMGERDKTELLVKVSCRFAFRVDHNQTCCNLVCHTDTSCKCIGKKKCSHTWMCNVSRQSANQNAGALRVTWKLPGQFGRQCRQLDRGRAQRIKTDKPLRRCSFDEYEYGSRLAFHILNGVLRELVVQHRQATIELRSIMLRAKGFADKVAHRLSTCFR